MNIIWIQKGSSISMCEALENKQIRKIMNQDFNEKNRIRFQKKSTLTPHNNEWQDEYDNSTPPITLIHEMNHENSELGDLRNLIESENWQIEICHRKQFSGSENNVVILYDLSEPSLEDLMCAMQKIIIITTAG